MDDYISRQAAIDAVNGIINRFEQILRDIRESKVDDSVCGLCEYDGAYISQSGDWCNECPGFDKDDCFKLGDECRKRWLKSVDLPSADVVSTGTYKQTAWERDVAIAQLNELGYSLGEKARHGYWDLQNDANAKAYGWHICSECGVHVGEPTNYCPNCGARMEGSEG